MANPHWKFADPMYGFRFGAAVIQRIAHIEGRYHVLGLDTPYRHVQIGISSTGRAVRVWIDGKEITSKRRSVVSTDGAKM